MSTRASQYGGKSIGITGAIIAVVVVALVEPEPVGLDIDDDDELGRAGLELLIGLF